MEKEKIEAGNIAPSPKVEDVKVLEQKQAQIENLNKAIQEANGELKKIRESRKAMRDAFEDKVEEPKIDFSDPASKAWDKHIKESVNPFAQEIEKEKQERFSYTLKEFVEDKPLLTGDKLESFKKTYERLKSSTGLTREGIIEDLNKAFAAEFHQELMGYARVAEVDQAKRLILQSDAGVSRGAGTYIEQREALPKYSLEQQEILAKWGVSTQEHAEMSKKYKDS